MSNPPVTPKPATRALNCPNCGAALVLRSMGQAINVVCDHCHAILDAKDPNLRILQEFQKQLDPDTPLIPLGTRGKLRGADYEVIGFQRRTIFVEGVHYSWREYLLFNPYKGYRYLSEYNGHWNDIAPCAGLPTDAGDRAIYLGKTYKHFQTAKAETTYVLGEFPWKVRYGDEAECTDYIDAPYMLSSEITENETTWSFGEYTPASTIWKAFNLPGSPPPSLGVYENQPSSLGISASAVWVTFFLLAAALLVLMVANSVLSAREPVFDQNYVFQQRPGQEASFVTPVFELQGRTSNVELKTTASVNNQWIYLNYALINDESGQAFDFGREVSYYHGYDSDGSWSEGSSNDSVFVPSVPPGRYYLRIEPESEAGARAIAYSVEVVRDVPVMSLYLVAFLALLLPALLVSWRIFNFEQMRWAESDHPIDLHLHSGDSD